LQSRADIICVIVDNMIEGIVFLDRRDVVLLINKSAAAIFEIDSSLKSIIFWIFCAISICWKSVGCVGGPKGRN